MLRNPTLLAVSLTICAADTGIGMIVPVRVLYAQSRGASLGIIGAMASAYLISNFVFQYPSGWIADRWGRKRIMVSPRTCGRIMAKHRALYGWDKPKGPAKPKKDMPFGRRIVSTSKR